MNADTIDVNRKNDPGKVETRQSENGCRVSFCLNEPIAATFQAGYLSNIRATATTIIAASKSTKLTKTITTATIFDFGKTSSTVRSALD
jgi:hypothetical protein